MQDFRGNLSLSPVESDMFDDPGEDYLYIRDTLDTAAAFGLAPAGATFERRMLGPSGFDTIIDMWLPLAWSLNMVSRSMGRDDLYPFVLPAAALQKMRFVHTAIDELPRT